MLAVLAVVVCLVALYFVLRRPRPKLPPGPPGLPLIGNIHQINNKCPMDAINKWTKQYGRIYHFQQLMETVVVLNSHDLIYEALVTRSNDFAGRPYLYRQKVVMNYVDDLVGGDSTPKWLYMKKLTMQSLKMYGDGLSNLEELSMEFIREMLDELEEHAQDGSSVDMKLPVHKCTGRIISSVLWGERLSDPDLAQLLTLERLALKSIETSGAGAELEFFPPLRYLPTSTVKNLDYLRCAFQELIAGRNKRFQDAIPTDEPSCFMEAVIKHEHRARLEGETMVLNDGEVASLAIALITAGTISTSTTMYCLIALLVNKPEIQDRITREIHEAIGHRPPSLSDRSSLPYTEAVILEILRYSSIAPVGVPHKATKDTTLGGYDIPNGTTVLVNLGHLHHSEEYWDKPWEFRPERFLNDDGTLLAPGQGSRKRLMAFGGGRRICVGEVLARNRLFLLVTSLLQRFHFKAETEGKLPAYDRRDYEAAGVMAPPEYRVKLVPVD